MNKKNVLILDPFCDKHLAMIRDTLGDDFALVKLSSECDEKILKDALKEAYIVIGEPPIEMLLNPETNCPNLKLVQMTWAGMDIYTRSPHKFPDSIRLLNASGAYGMIISQYVLGMILALMLRFKEYQTQQENKIWKRRGPVQSLDGARVLIYGAGDIGSATAKRLLGFDAYTIGVCRDTSRVRPYFNELCTLDNSEKYLSDADVVVGCLPNSEETEGFLDYDKMKLMKKGAIVVNVGRGNFIDCMALNELLNEGHLWGAGLDVTNPEPLPLNHPLWENPRCIITPHSSGASFGNLPKTEDMICEIVCKNISQYIS